MKQLNETFEDEEFKELLKLKNKFNLSWRAFILMLKDHANDSIKKGNLKPFK